MLVLVGGLVMIGPPGTLVLVAARVMIGPLVPRSMMMERGEEDGEEDGEEEEQSFCATSHFGNSAAVCALPT